MSKERWLHGRRRARRSYSTFKVRRGGGEDTYNGIDELLKLFIFWILFDSFMIINDKNQHSLEVDGGIN